MRKKKKIMLHIIMPNQVSGPNNAAKRIGNSYLSDEYEFSYLIQEKHAGGRVNISLIKSLKKQIIDTNPDMLHLSGLQSSGFHAVIAARLAGYNNLLMTVRGFSEDSINCNFFKKKMFNIIFEPLTLLLVKNVLIVTKESLKKPSIKKLNKEKFLGILHNAAPEYDMPIVNSSFRYDIGLSEKDIIVVIVGRMVYDKGISFILDSIKKCENQNVKYVFIGDGPYLDIIESSYQEELHNKKIILLGQVKNVMDILSTCDIFLFATLHENLSNSLLEAMSAGLPVICTSVGGNLEVMEEEGNGYFIRPSDSQDIIDKINLMIKNREKMEIFANRSREIIEEKFSQKVIYSQLNEYYKNMLGSK